MSGCPLARLSTRPQVEKPNFNFGYRLTQGIHRFHWPHLAAANERPTESHLQLAPLASNTGQVVELDQR